MAGTVNKVILIGRLGADPDVRYMADGTPVINFNMATDEPILSAEGNWEKRPEWHRIVARKKLAEIMANFLSKGKLVYVEGKLQTRQWQDNQGVKRFTTEIVARDIQLMDSGGNRPAQGSTGEGYNKTGGAPSFASQAEVEELPPPPNRPDDEIPF
jgi:single-strand DNA-binding protein